LSTRRPASRAATAVPETNGTNGASGERSSVVLGPNDRLVGQLFIEGDVRVSGSVEGTLEATGDVEIGGAGKVKGDVTAYNRLTVGSNASLIAGVVRVARLTVEDGATFSGKVSMGKHVAPSKAPEPLPVPTPGAQAMAVEPEPQAIAVEPTALKPAQKGRRR
jgi:cytoskeletal protein CcmA (bactofilin family)